MGVVHKLKTEVIDFIISEKRLNPKLSCRNIAELATGKFQTSISKSSVNIILKSANLSSAIGRRTGSENSPEKSTVKGLAAKTKYKLPPEKKLKVQLPTALPAGPSLPSEVESPPQASIQKEWLPGMGMIFLLAAFWELSLEKPIRELLSKLDIDELGNEQEIETLVFYNLLMDNGLEDVGLREQGLFHLSESNPTKILETRRTLESLPLANDLLLKGQQSIYQSCVCVRSFGLKLKDNSRLMIDPQLTTVWEGEVPSRYLTPINKAMTILSSSIITNRQCAYFRVYRHNHRPNGHRPEGHFNDQMLNLIMAFETQGEKAIESIKVFDTAGDIIADFSTIPNIKRQFIIGVDHLHKEFQALTKPVKWAGKDSLMLPWNGIRISFADTTTDYLGEKLSAQGQSKLDISMKLRVHSLYLENEGNPQYLLLTNNTREAKENILAFMLRWPNVALEMSGKVNRAEFDENNRHDNIYRPRKNLYKDDDFDAYSKAVIELLNEYTMHMYGLRVEGADQVNVNDSMRNIYKIKGFLKKGDKFIKVDLHEQPFNSSIVDQFNEREILDSMGRRIILGA